MRKTKASKIVYDKNIKIKYKIYRIDRDNEKNQII